MKLSRIIAAVALVLLVASQWFIWSYAPEAQSGPVQRIFYFHLPMSWWGLISFLVVCLASVGYILRRDMVFDAVAGAAAELGVLCCTLSLVTGMIWARAEWGAWWVWEPKLTTALIMWYIYAAYLVLRNSSVGGERKLLICAVLGILGFVDVPLVFFSAKLWGSVLHPVDLARKSSGMAPKMWHTVIVSLSAFGALWLSLLLVRIGQLRATERLKALLVWDDSK